MDFEYILGCVYFACWLGSLMWVTFTTLLAVSLLPNRWALAYLAILWGTLVIPLDRPMSRWGRHFMTLSIKAAYKRHKVQITYEDKAALTPGRPYVVGYEPHSVLPFALQTVLCDLAPARAPGFKDLRILATTGGFYVPLLRHIWWWLGTRSADKKSMSAILAAGGTAVLIPGGVQECGYLEPGKETVFLKSRKGFVRMAMQHGAPLVPVFCFGQTRMMSFRHLGPPLMPRAAVKKLARIIGVLPMAVWGWWGTTLTHPVPVHMVIGKPIEVPRKENLSRDDPDVQKYLQQFIAALTELFEKHKSAAGYADLKLQVL